MVQTTTLKSGVRVVIKRMEGLLSVTMGVLVGTGAAYERDEEDGISHFVEHMQFKGTPSRTAFEISDAFDAIGAQVNAFTGKDLTCYYAKATTGHAAEAFGLLADLFLNANFPAEEMEREKGVVIEEIRMDEDSPEDLCLDLLARATFGTQSYGRNILGPAEHVKNFSREDLFAYKNKRYCPQDIVISFAGNICPEEAAELAERYFGDMPAGAYEERDKAVVLKRDNLFRKRPIEQAHFALSFPTVVRDDALMPAVQVMNAVLGGGLSSRLFKRVREELGLAYSVYSYTTHYPETGLLCVYAGVNPEKIGAAAEEVVKVLRTFRAEGMTEEEFRRGREQALASNIFAQENTSSQMLIYGKQMLYRNELYDFERRMDELARVTMEDIREAIRRSLDFSDAAVATVGNLKEGISL